MSNLWSALSFLYWRRRSQYLAVGVVHGTPTMNLCLYAAVGISSRYFGETKQISRVFRDLLRDLIEYQRSGSYVYGCYSYRLLKCLFGGPLHPGVTAIRQELKGTWCRRLCTSCEFYGNHSLNYGGERPDKPGRKWKTFETENLFDLLHLLYLIVTHSLPSPA